MTPCIERTKGVPSDITEGSGVCDADAVYGNADAVEWVDGGDDGDNVDDLGDVDDVDVPKIVHVAGRDDHLEGGERFAGGAGGRTGLDVAAQVRERNSRTASLARRT